MQTEAQRIGAMLRELREEKGMTQKQLEESTGIKQNNIHRIESGQFDLKVGTVARILKVFDRELKF